ncbi:MAG TPA: restriction endonuclease [Verrucomicrobiae bacterium]
METPPPLPSTPPDAGNTVPPLDFVKDVVETSPPILMKRAQRAGWVKRIIKGRRVPWPVIIVAIIVLPAALFFGPAALGIVALGVGIGMPILLVAFVIALAVIGTVTLVRSLRKDPVSTAFIGSILTRIAHDEALRRVRNDLRTAMTAAPVPPQKQPLGGSECELRQKLLLLSPVEFERHVMAFFQDKGLFAWVTQQSNDAGVDGFARHPEGLIVVQCKRNAPDNPVGRPIVQQFKGVVEENMAWRGYVVTTSYFTGVAKESAEANQRLRLIDMGALARWHTSGIDF